MTPGLNSHSFILFAPNIQHLYSSRMLQRGAFKVRLSTASQPQFRQLIRPSI